MGGDVKQRCFKHGIADPSKVKAFSEEELDHVVTHFRDRILQKFKEANTKELVYTGGTGIALAFAHCGIRIKYGKLDRLLYRWREESVGRARERPSDWSSLLCGVAGQVFSEWLTCANGLGHNIGDSKGLFGENSLKLLQEYANLDERHNEDDEWLYGKAGYLCGLTLMQRRLDERPPEVERRPDFRRVRSLLRERRRDIAIGMLRRGVEYADEQRRRAESRQRGDGELIPPTLWHWYGEEYLGAAHGVAGIWYQLLCLCHRDEKLLDEAHVELLRRSCQHAVCCMRNSVREGPQANFPAVLGEETAHLIHFCHGAPGFCLLFCKAHEVFPREAMFLEEALKQAELVWRYGILKKGLGLCHGVAGNAYCFLAVYRLLNASYDNVEDARDSSHMRPERQAKLWLDRAHAFGRCALAWEKDMRVPDRPFSLFEGIAGTMCFFWDLKHPETAQMPIFEA